ncbi:MAG: hypothetical protein ACXU9C_04370 [Xanthobacteraceae bacterium]
MPKKSPIKTPHLRVRIEPKLLAKLEKSREKNAHTLTGEIVTRLEQSFETEDRLALFREAMDRRIEDVKSQADRDLVAHQARLEAFGNKTAEKIAEQAAVIRELEQEVGQVMRAAAVVDVLLGNDKLKSDLLRHIALDLADASPDWSKNEASRRQLADRVASQFFSTLQQLQAEGD